MQQRALTALLRHAWARSPFYREYYAGHGIREQDLAHVGVRDLPFVTKSALMEHFDAMVTDGRLRKAELLRWFEGYPPPHAVFHPDFVTLVSSGTSGTLGIVAYDRVGWRAMNSVVSSWLPGPEPGQAGKTRVAFYAGIYRQTAVVMTSRSLAPALHDVLLLSILDEPERVAARLNAFQPHRLVGYSSALTTLAEWSLAGRLHIAPLQIIAGSDRLTRSMEETIVAAWGAPVYLVYGAAESIYIALRAPGDVEMTVLDDLNIVEILDPGRRAVGPGEVGRVVLTNLYNYAWPVIRYELDDEVVRGAVGGERGFGTIREIQGRSGAVVPVVLDDGSPTAIPAVMLMALTVPDLQRVQFVALGPEHIRVDYVARGDRDAGVRREVARVLATYRASRTAFSVRRVAQILPDPRTGKIETVRMEWQPDAMCVPAPTPAPAGQPARVAPDTPFIPFPRSAIEQSIVTRFEEQVAAHADRPAVVADGDVLTYGDLNGRANQLARALQTLGDNDGSPVALLSSHGAPTIAAMLGVLKAGRTFVPLDPTFPPDRLRAMIEDAGATAIATDARHRDLAASLSGSRSRVLDADAIPTGEPTDNLPGAIPPDAIAYILYTSGSTGGPRGVVQTHRTVLHNIMKYTNGAHLAADDRMTMLLSFSFSAAMTNVFGALLNGAALVPFDVRGRGLAGLPVLLREASITIFKAVPTVFRLFCDGLGADERFPALRLVELIGEPVTARDVERFRDHFSAPCLLHNRFGATEMHVIRQHFLDAETPVAGGVVPVGYAVDDTDVLIVDDDGRPLGTNCLGEIVIRSPFLAAGYWRRPDLTRAAFRPDPAGGAARTYRTGDLGLMRPDGCLEHHGRKDAQAKIRGQRIEVGEIESALLALPFVGAAAAVVRDDRENDPRLVAYLVAASGPAPTTATLRRALASSLPTHMIPSAFVWLPILPLLPTGKVDRRALPPPPSDPRGPDSPYVAPATPFEERLAGIWTEILGLDRIGVHDDFFELGGHSLLAMQILSRVRDAFEVDVPMRRFFEAPTVAAQAAAVVECWLEGLPSSEQDRILGDPLEAEDPRG